MRTDELICMMAKNPPCSCNKRNVIIWSAVAALFAVFTGVSAVLLGFRNDLEGIITGKWMMAFKYAFLLAAVIGSGVAWWYSGHPGRNYKIALRGLVFLAALLGAVAVASFFMTPLETLRAHLFDGTALICIGFIAAFTIAGSFALAAVTQCMAPLNCRVHAFFTVLFSGALGALAYGLHCSHDHPDYLALWYAGTVLLVGFVVLPLLMRKQAW